MCGIALVLSKNGDLQQLYRITESLERSLAYRGPDDTRITYPIKHIGLVHTRLSINGLGDGHQPFLHAHENLIGGNVYSAVNGEIYNYPYLKHYYGLRNLFSRSDCEVLGYGYARDGINSLNKLDGMFAGIIVDLKNRKIVTVRDFFGEKPLYIYQDDSILILSSSVRSIVMSLEDVSFTVERKKIGSFLRYQFIPEGSLFSEIHEVPKGQIIEFDFAGAEINSTTLEYPYREHSSLEEELDYSVSRVSLSDVPISVALSGGLDSGLILHYMHTYNIELSPLTIDNETRSSEWDGAFKTANQYGYDCRRLTIPRDYFHDYLQDKYPRLDSPFGDITSAAYYFLCEEAKSSGSKVILFGHGLDEFFFGYRWVNDTALGLISNIDEEQYSYSSGSTNLFSSCPYVVDTAPHFNKLFGFNQEESGNHISYHDSIQSTNDVCNSIIDLYLQKNGLLQLDNISMAIGIEARSPFVSQRLFYKSYQEYNKLPDSKKIETLKNSKHLIRRHVRNNIEPMQHSLAPKTGFSPDVNTWHNIIRSEYFKNWDNYFLVNTANGGLQKETAELMPLNALRVLYMLDSHLTSYGSYISSELT